MYLYKRKLSIYFLKNTVGTVPNKNTYSSLVLHVDRILLSFIKLTPPPRSKLEAVGASIPCKILVDVCLFCSDSCVRTTENTPAGLSQITNT